MKCVTKYDINTDKYVCASVICIPYVSLNMISLWHDMSTILHISIEEYARALLFFQQIHITKKFPEPVK